MAKRNGGNKSTRDIVTRLDERFDNYILGPTGLVTRFGDLEKAVRSTNQLLESNIQPLLVDHTRIMKDLYGDPNAEDADERKGELVRVDDHFSSHRKINAAILGMLGTLSVAIASMWRDILKGLGLVK